MNKPVIRLTAFIFFSISLVAGGNAFGRSLPSATLNPKDSLAENISEKLILKGQEAKAYALKKGFNEKYCFLVDMSIPSGKNRFFVYDLVNNQVVKSGLVAHGCGTDYYTDGLKFSNEVGSLCTSLGRYKIGNSYYGNFGYSYKLFGLDSSNSNAYERTVVLHSHSHVPEIEVDGEICLSNGCPMVSVSFLNELKPLINTSKKPVLLWIYN